MCGDFFTGEPEPFAAWGAMLVPVKAWVVGQDLQAAADQQAHEEKIDPVGGP